MDINAVWNLLCDKINLHNESLAKHKNFIKEYMTMSDNRLNINEKLDIKHKTKDNTEFISEGKSPLSIKEIEFKIRQLRNIQEKLYEEIKGHVRDYYKKTNYDYDDIEKLFRANKLSIYLVADKIDRNKLIPGTDLVDKDNVSVNYRVDFIVTDSASYYLEQLGIECTEDNINDATNKDIIVEIIQQNLSNLSLCGDIIVVDKEETQNALANLVNQSKDIEDLNDY